MGLTRADLVDPNISEKDKAEIAAVINRYLENEELARKILAPVGVLLTSHPNNRPYLKASVESHKKLGYFLALGYDNYVSPNQNDTSLCNYLPAKDVLDICDAFIVGPYQTWGGVLYPFHKILRLGVFALSSFEYIYCANADCVLERPEGFPLLLERLGDADIMTIGWENIESSRPIANTTGFIAKSSALTKIVQHFTDHFIPFAKYEEFTQEYGNAESRFAIAIRDLHLKVVGVEPPFNTQLHKPGYGTWYDIVGFHHTHAEHNYAYRNRGIPPHYKYLDERYMGSEYHKIKKYWDTQDITVLEDWWAKS